MIHKRQLGRMICLALACCFLVEYIAVFGGDLVTDPSGAYEPDIFNNDLDDVSPVESDTVISKGWEAIETLDSWWNANWLYRKKVVFTEPGLMDRDKEPTDVYLTFTGNVAHVNSIRLAYFGNDSAWHEVPSQLWNVTLDGTLTYYVSCTLFFFLNITKYDTDVYYVYYDPVISTAPTYTDHITTRARVRTEIINEGTNARRPEVYHVNGTTFFNTNSFEVVYDGNTVTPAAVVALVDTMRGGSDWGGASCGLTTMRYGATDALSTTTQQWFSFGEMALDAIGYDAANDVPNGFSGAYRINVGPDNPAEAWDGNGRVDVVEDGPLFTKVRVRTTDGAFSDFQPTDAATWFLDDLGLGLVDDSYTRGNGGIGYVNYTIEYTFYYYAPATFVKIDLKFTANPQRGTAANGYPRTNVNYQDTNMWFKNYGDWPHLMQLVDATEASASIHSRKSWYGSKYGLYTDPNLPTAKRRDYPVEAWTAWWDDTGDPGSQPTIGMSAVTNGIGWEVLSLAVDTIGPNSLLQQILPEGHQGSQFMIPRGNTMSYEYYLLTSAYGTQYNSMRDISRRMNDRVLVEVSDVELFSNNGLFIHVNDIAGNTAYNTYVRLYNSTNDIVYDEQVDSIGNVTFLRLPDDQYTVQAYFFTPNLLNQYTIRQETFYLDHLVNRSTYRNYDANIANLSFYVVNWARSSEALTGGLIRLRNATSTAIVEQNITWDGYVTFRLYTDGSTQYNIELLYGGQARIINITNPFTLTTNSLINVGAQVDTTSLSVETQSTSVILGSDYTITFRYHKSNDINFSYVVQDVTVSSQFDADYWTPGADYTWWDAGGGVTGLNLTTGFTSRLNASGVHAVYIHAINTTVETATEKLFVLLNPIPTDITVTLNDTVTNQIDIARGLDILLEIDYPELCSGAAAGFQRPSM